VDENRFLLSGLKTHDYHIIFQKLLPLVLRNILPEEVVVPLIDLSRFFRSLCSKEQDENELAIMSASIWETICRLEMIFPPTFFDIMVHLPVHLAEEAALGGPICYRWMYPVERYLRTVNGYEEEAEIDVDSLLVGVEVMTVRSDQVELMNWR